MNAALTTSWASVKYAISQLLNKLQYFATRILSSAELRLEDDDDDAITIKWCEQRLMGQKALVRGTFFKHVIFLTHSFCFKISVRG